MAPGPPGSLVSLCVATVAAKLKAAHADGRKRSGSGAVEAFLPARLGNRLLSECGWAEPIPPALLKLFTPAFASLTQVHLVDPPLEGLAVLSRHTLDTLAIRKKKDLPLNEFLVNCVSKGTRASLRNLDLSYSLCVKKRRLASIERDITRYVNAICKSFVGLESLKLRGAPVADAHVEALAAALPNLLYVDLSNTKMTSLKPLARYALYNVEVDCEWVGVLTDFEALEVLDLSRGSLEPAEGPQAVYHGHLLLLAAYNRLLTSGSVALPRLRSLELSGLENYFEAASFASFVQTHRELRYLGLSGTNADAFACVEEATRQRGVVVTGRQRTEQLVRGMEAYLHGDRVKAFYDAVSGLVGEIRQLTFDEALPAHLRQSILPLALRAFREFPASFPVLVGTSALLNLFYSHSFAQAPRLSHAAAAGILHQYLLVSIRHLATKSSKKLNRNIWLFLQTHFVEAGMTMPGAYAQAFVELGVEVMVKYNGDMVLLPRILHFVRTQLVDEDVVKLTGPKLERAIEFMVKLLRRHFKWVAENGDSGALGQAFALHSFVLDSGVHILVSLTDESPEAAAVLLLQPGAGQLLVDMLERAARALPPDPRAEPSDEELLLPYGLLLLLMNVAEGSEDCAELCSRRSLETLAHFLISPAEQLHFVAGGVVGNLFAEGEPEKGGVGEAALAVLAERVLGWGSSAGRRAVGFRSFRPFRRLLRRSKWPGVQLWALWAIRHSAHLEGSPERLAQLRGDGVLVDIQVLACSRPPIHGPQDDLAQRCHDAILRLSNDILRLAEPPKPAPQGPSAVVLSC